MVVSTTILWDNVLVEASSYTIVQSVPLDLLVSSIVSNTTHDKVKITINYTELDPLDAQGNWHIGAILEYKDANGNWTITGCHQFSALRRGDVAPLRELIMAEDISTLNLGEEETIAPLGDELCRISREKGCLPPADLRVRVVLLEKDTAHANAWVSMRVTAEMVRDNV